MTSPDGLLLTRDLMFTSKVTGTAAAVGRRIEVVGNVEQLALRVAEAAPRAVFLDLSVADLDVPQVILALPVSGRPVVIAFGSHVDEATLNAARDAGCDEVMPRSKFSQTLPELLQRVLAPAIDS